MPNRISSITNKDLYIGSEFKAWAYREKLDAEEVYLVDKYLHSSRKTLEAGTAGGRILLSLNDKGFSDLHGFDYIPEFIEAAKAKDTSKKIDFSVQNAVSLTYKDESFDQIIYLQQIISSIDLADDRLNSLKESYRILRKGGVGLFSFLSFEVRNSALGYSWFIAYLKLLRQVKRSNETIQYLPWLLRGGSFNLGALIDRPPYTYWYRVEEISQVMKEIGFRIISIGTSEQVKSNSMKVMPESLMQDKLDGALYIVVEK
jgi:ubiquinone/menaquinone biosynthesis C-methylase UbiE